MPTQTPPLSSPDNQTMEDRVHEEPNKVNENKFPPNFPVAFELLIHKLNNEAWPLDKMSHSQGKGAP
jgi:hypothetical protein